MPLYGGIDLHANNSVIVLLNEQDEVIYRKRSHSTELRGGAPTPFVIPLQLCGLTPILGHQLQRPSDLR
jgi:hypothetical protein